MLYVDSGAVVDGRFGAVHNFQTCPLRIVAARSIAMVETGDPCKAKNVIFHEQPRRLTSRARLETHKARMIVPRAMYDRTAILAGARRQAVDRW